MRALYWFDFLILKRSMFFATHSEKSVESRWCGIRVLCSLTATASWKPSIFSSVYILPLPPWVPCRSISFAGGIYLFGCRSGPGEQSRGLFDECLIKGLLIDLETESREHNQWSIVYCFWPSSTESPDQPCTRRSKSRKPWLGLSKGFSVEKTTPQVCDLHSQADRPPKGVSFLTHSSS